MHCFTATYYEQIPWESDFAVMKGFRSPPMSAGKVFFQITMPKMNKSCNNEIVHAQFSNFRKQVISIGPTNSQSIAVKEFWFSRVEFEVLMCGGLCAKYIATNFPQIEGRESTENFAKISPRFSSVSLKFTAKNFTRISLWGTMDLISTSPQGGFAKGGCVAMIS